MTNFVHVSETDIPHIVKKAAMSVYDQTFDRTKHNHFAIALYKNRIVSVGHNIPLKTHPFQEKYAMKLGLFHKIYLHSEIDALVKSHTKVDEIWVLRINRSGQLLNSKPCKICCLAIREAEIETCYFS